MADLCRGVPDWVPATEVHGEGIFLKFSESRVASWEQKKSVQARDAMLRAGHDGWRNARRLEPSKGYPGIRYAMLHTFSHLLIRELALECGYNAASIRERIYANLEGETPMAGILLYTAAADSDGTLGGLVELGKPENLAGSFSKRFTEPLSAPPTRSALNTTGARPQPSCGILPCLRLCSLRLPAKGATAIWTVHC